ncbi:MAG TPA: ChbG/HpnK family deacetylase [Anaeromyxobacter sp.]|nr:ChbG/HpnK family deacetylase [Anaeromyxobacter sp.]
MKLLVINADDLGYDPEIDRGILEAHARGLVTSTTAMVQTAFARAALGAAPATLGVGLHAVLAPTLSCADAEAALRVQLARFEDLRGAAPTHLDSHKHAHAAPAILDAFAAVAVERGLPVRAIDPAMRAVLRARGVVTADRLLGDAARRPAWTEEELLAALTRLEDGATEIMAHPGYAPSHARTSFGREREVELAALCSARTRAAADASGAVRCDYAVLAARARAGGVPGAPIVDP